MFKKDKLFILLYAATTKVFVSLVGQLMVAEILAFLTLPFIKYRSLFKKYKGLSTVILSLSVLLIIQIISDLLNQSNPTDFLRGWSSIVFSMISIVFLVHSFSKNSSLIFYYLFAVFIANLVFRGNGLDLNLMDADDNYFKSHIMGFVNPLIILISAWLFKSRNKRLGFYLILAYAFLSIILGARSNGLIFLISSLLISIRLFNYKFTKSKLIITSIFLLGVLYLGYIYYVNKVITEGFGGINATEQLSEADNPYNPFELLFYGRTETVVALYAIAEKPIIGHGSWGRDKNYKYARLMQSLKSGSKVNYKKGFIPSHSIIFTAWLWSGIFGFFAICYMFRSVILKFLSFYKSSPLNYKVVIITILVVDMIWNLLFSPYGHLRTTIPLVVAFVIVYYNQNNYILHLKEQYINENSIQ